MKKNHIFLFILSGIFLIGILCIVIGINLGGTLFDLHRQDDNASTAYVTGTTTPVTNGDNSQIQELSFSFQTEDITIVSGAQYQVNAPDCRYHSYVEDGVWHLKTDTSQWTLTILNHTLKLPHVIPTLFSFSDRDASITVTIPEDAALSQFSLSMATGDCEIQSVVHADSAKFTVLAGTISMKELYADRATCKVNAGDLSIDQMTISDECHVAVNSGDFSLGDSAQEDLFENEINNLQVSVSTGDFEAFAKLTGSSDLTCSLGDIDLHLTGAPQNYQITTDCSMGDIDIDDYASNGLSQNNTKEDIFGDVFLKCTMGDISASFSEYLAS